MRILSTIISCWIWMMKKVCRTVWAGDHRFTLYTEDVWDEDSAYLEMLEKEVSQLSRVNNLNLFSFDRVLAWERNQKSRLKGRTSKTQTTKTQMSKRSLGISARLIRLILIRRSSKLWPVRCHIWNIVILSKPEPEHSLPNAKWSKLSSCDNFLERGTTDDVDGGHAYSRSTGRGF